MNLKARISSLGPGLLYAGAAIGVSHLVQSTTAGALYGYALIAAIVIANLVKYPFFEAGSRYAAVTGKSLLDGYEKLGKWAVWLILIVTVSTMFTIQAAVTVVTAGIAEKLFGISFEGPIVWSAFLLIICILLLALGKYTLLDKMIKVIMVLLAITTLIALFFSFDTNVVNETKGEVFSYFNGLHIAFLITLLGWMPAPMDISIWQSLWSVEKQKIDSVSLKSSLFDFKVGFWGTLILAVCFLTLGANVLYGTGEVIEGSASKFAAQLLRIYTSSIGEWSFYLIAVAAFFTMFSTTLTCLDAVPRVLKNIVQKLPGNTTFLSSYWFYILLVSAGTLTVLTFFISSMGQMIKIATVISFLTAPFIAILNYMVIYKTDLTQDQKPSKGMQYFSVFGICLLVGFAIYYLYVLFA